MQDYFRAVFTPILSTLLSCSGAQVDSVEKLVISIETENSEMAESEISALAIGEPLAIGAGAGKGHRAHKNAFQRRLI